MKSEEEVKWRLDPRVRYMLELIAVWELYNPRWFSGFTGYTTKMSVHVEETLPSPLPPLPPREFL
ncbi:hypothetical protein H5410_047909 [Solanum commersonii]|uniref:Uncharacterized protein n=1 Tax=Solanum commersonii TaxID=4109 RepID=A0A9J5XGJ1_SOLCO|nr:hypothetical protein H5410_047909 [Solanum commersonii]